MKKQKKKSRHSKQTHNRQYKDRLWRMIFNNKKDLLQLYNAINHTDYQNPDDLEVNTLEDVFYLSMKNDVSFLVGGTMNLYEHQSTFNPNMPLRGVFYFSRLYEGYVADNNLMIYHEKRVRLPKPKYIVFYNGTKNQPDSMELKLSDCFENTDNEAPCLECTATMLNINYGHNQELLKHCRRLKEYSIFVQCVREYIQSESSVEDALEKAIDTCINQDVLADFLKKHRAEVTNMILTTYDKDLYEKTLKEDAREEGRKEGMEYLNQLNKYLLKAKRYNDLERATEDIEYQKKLNPNMPLRGVFYFSRLYEGYVADNNLMIYHEKRVRLPKPKYIVFYNGTKNQPDSMELRLSDCFENTDNEAPCLECTATMLNINYGHNQELMKHCRRLKEYSIFVQCVRDYIQSEPSVEDALEKAIDTCINQDVLADFLKKHRAEVTNMILTTYDKDLYEKTLKEDAREEGREEGRAEIRAELNEFKLLNKCLLKAKRYNDLERATEDIEYQKKLLKEFGIE